MNVTQSDVQHARDLYNAGQLSQMYDYLASKGDRYAQLANGVASGNTFSGIMALEHLKSSAVTQGMTWTQSNVQDVRERMGDAYLTYLSNQFEGGTTTITQNISATDAQFMHNDVFEGMGLSDDAWTLNTPFNVMTDSDRDAYWNEVLNTAGDSMGEINAAYDAVRAVAEHSDMPGAAGWLQDFLRTDAVAAALQGSGIELDSLAKRVADQNYEATGSAWWGAVVMAMTELPAYAAAGWGMLLDLLGGDEINQEVSDTFNLAQVWRPRRDPLVLDLNGNGIETTAPNSTNPILFDHNGDGVKTGTGWVSPSDGFLVMDRNGNRVIDNGTELFGDHTPLANGGFASDGFTALTALDSNQDGVIGAADGQFAQLKVWRDLNPDRLSQSNELQTLLSSSPTWSPLASPSHTKRKS